MTNKIAFVAEAWGREEAKVKIPLVGDSGKLLDRLFTAAGLKPRLSLDNYGNVRKVADNGMLITNVIQERPLNNNILPFIHVEAGVVHDKAVSHIKRLKQELKAADPNVIVACGNVSLWVLTGKKGIMNYHGSILESTLIPGKKVIPIIHPAAALREHIYTHMIAMDLVRVRKEAETLDIDLPKWDLIIDPTFGQVAKYLTDIKPGSMVSCDIETITNRLFCISFGKNDGSAISIPFYDENLQPMWTADDHSQIWLLIREVLESPVTHILGQNFSYDYAALKEWNHINPTNIQDTMVAQRIAFPDLPAGLNFLTTQYTRQPYYKDEGKDYMRAPKGGDLIKFWKYNAMDSVILHPIFEQQCRELQRLKNTEAYKAQVSLIPVLIDMQFRGVKIDMKAMKKAHKDGWTEWDEMFKELRDEVGEAPIPKKNHKKFWLEAEAGMMEFPSETRLFPWDPKMKKFLTSTGELSIMKLKKGFGDRLVVEKYDGYTKFEATPKPNNPEEWNTDIIGSEFPNSDAQKKRYFYDYLGLKPILSRDHKRKDKRKVDDEAMRKLAKRGVYAADLINRMAKIHKLITTYYNIDKVSKDGRLRCQYKVVGTKTGRLASAATQFGKGMNQQNSPPAMKPLFLADD